MYGGADVGVYSGGGEGEGRQEKQRLGVGLELGSPAALHPRWLPVTQTSIDDPTEK